MRRHGSLGSLGLSSLAFALACATGCASSQTATAPAAPAAAPTAAAVAAAPVAAAPAAPGEAPVPALEFPNEDFRKQQPNAGPARALKTPALQRFTLPNGIAVYLVERPTLPIVSMSLSFEGGSATDPAGKEGRASLCAGLLSAGTEKLDRIAFEEALADIASEIGSGASEDQHWVTADALKKSLGPTLDLFADTLQKPGLRADEFERHVKRRIAGLAQMKGNPAAVAGRLTGSIVHGPTHPLGRFATEASYGALGLDDCKKFVADYVKPQGARLFVVGAITKAELTNELGARLKPWTGKPKAPAVITASKPRQGRIFFVDMPNAPQSVVQLVHLGPPRKAPDFQQTAIMGSILGGGFTSRINMNIREKHGYAYGARAGFEYTRKGGLFRAGASVRTNVTKESILEMCKEIRALKASDEEGAPKADELLREKNGRILALPAQFSTGGQTLGAFRDLVYYDLPLNYYDTLVAKVEAVDGNAVKKAAAKYLKPENLQLLVVGDGKTVLPKLKELAAGKELPGSITVLDTDGKPVSDAKDPNKEEVSKN
jgi:zinc protease